jgi:tetratricopeptide (TPR) repeat protein
MRKLTYFLRNLIFFICLLLSINLITQNVPPSISDPEELRATQIERQKVFDSIIDDPTNLENLFNYANLSILVGDLEAAIGVFEQMLIYKPDLPRIKLELGVLYFRLGAYASAKRYLDDVENYNPPKEVKEKVEVFLEQIDNETRLFKTQSVISLGAGMSSNANAGLDTDVVTVVGDLGAIDLNISNKPKSDLYYSAAFSSQITQDLRHPRGDTINYVVSLSRQVYRDFSNFDSSTGVFSVNRKFNMLDDEKLRLTNQSFTPSLTAFKVFLQGSELLRSHRVDIDWKATLMDSGTFGLNVYFDERDFLGSQNKTGDFIGIGLSRSIIFPKSGIFLSYKTNYEHFYATSPIETYIKRSFDVSTRQALNSTTFATTNVAYSYKDYEQKDPFLGLRSDKAISLRFGLTKIIDLCWNSDVGLSFSTNKSTVGLYARSNEGFSVKFNYLCTP